MQLQDVQQKVAGVPHMSTQQATAVYDHFRRYRPTSVLELGFAHGVSTCYLAGALEEFGQGRVTTIDRAYALKREPNINELLERCGLAHIVDVITTPTSYTWELMRLLESVPQPRFDYVYIDGAHLWDVDGFAFHLVDRLLIDGGWVVFDDLDWYLDSSPSMRATDWVKQLPDEQRTTKQVRKVFELLVQTHPGYGEFRDENGWGWARKVGSPRSRLFRRK